MIALQTVVVAFSMFSALPMPQIEWNEKNMRWSLCAFPLVGTVIGLCVFLWLRLCAALSLPDLLRGAGLCLLPVGITGGIHLDGYADTCDALASHAGADKRQEILKDPHLGAFAAIRLCSYFLASFVLSTVLADLRLAACIGLFGFSRSLSGYALTRFTLRPGSGLARSFADAADKKKAGLVLAAESAVFAALLICGGGALAALAAALVLLVYRRIGVKGFGGLSGDLAGWFLQTAELWMLGMLVLTQMGRNWL